MLKLFLGIFAFFLTFVTFSMADTAMNSNNQKTVVILLGAPGSGKGTQAKKISQELNLPHISTGDLFRENLSKGTPLGLKVKSYLESGNLVPDQIVIEMLMDRVKADDCKYGYLLDGFPRSIPQAEALQKEFSDNTKVVVLNLQVPDELIIKRIEGRMTCKDCGNIYNKYFSPVRVDNVCDKCSGELSHRSDDNATAVEQRLKVYHEQNTPLEEYYEKKGILKNVNGQQDPDKVFEDLMKSLKLQ